MHFSTKVLLPLFPILAITTAFPSTSPSLTTLPRATKPYQLRGVVSPIFHLYLQPLPSNKSMPVMGPEATSEYYIIGSTIQSTNSSLYLNIGTNPAGKSYLPLSFGAASVGSPWGLEGDTVVTATGSIYGRQLNFLACPDLTSGYYDMYLQTGSDVPSGVSCSNYQTVHTPCLC